MLCKTYIKHNVIICLSFLTYTQRTMAPLKKTKVNAECHALHEKWAKDYFFVNLDEPVCPS